MANSADRRMQITNATLEKIDKLLNEMIVEIMREKDIAETRGITTEIDTENISEFNTYLNSIHIEGNESVLIAINDKYNKAIEALKTAIENEEEQYKEQFKHELKRVEDNKSKNFDSIAETYKEISARLDRGEIQSEYYQEKANRVQKTIEVKDEIYDEKIGNADRVLIAIEPEIEKVKEKETIKKEYEKLLELNNDIENLENEIADPNITEEEKHEKEEKLEELKEKRKLAVEKFVKTAKDKDGKRYPKAEGKSDKDYINELDATRIDEALTDSIDKFNSAILTIDPSKRKITKLNKDLQEVGEIDIASMLATDYESAKDIVDLLNTQKSAWDAKKISDGYDKTKLQIEKRELESQASAYSRYSNSASPSTNTLNANTRTDLVPSKAWDWKHPLASVKNFFRRRKEEKILKKNVPEGLDVNEAKTAALKDLEKNKKNLAAVNVNNRNRDREKFEKSVNYNVKITEKAIRDFWNTPKSKDDDDKSR